MPNKTSPAAELRSKIHKESREYRLKGLRHHGGKNIPQAGGSSKPAKKK